MHTQASMGDKKKREAAMTRKTNLVKYGGKMTYSRMIFPIITMTGLRDMIHPKKNLAHGNTADSYTLIG